MSINKDDDKVVYRSCDKENSIIYEIEVSNYEYRRSLMKVSVKSKSDVKIYDLSGDFTLELKEILMKAYMHLTSEDFLDLFKRLDMIEIKKFTNSTRAYIGGERNEEYAAYVDDFGNLLLVTNYVYHYNHGSSSLYRIPAGDYSFMRELSYFARGLFIYVRDYQTFIASLNEETLRKYFVMSYVPNHLK